MFRIVCVFLCCFGGVLQAQPPTYGAVIERSLFQEELLFPVIMDKGNIDRESTIYYALLGTLELLSQFELEEVQRQDLNLNSKYPAGYLSNQILSLQQSEFLEFTPGSIQNAVPIDSLNSYLFTLPQEQQSEVGEDIFSLKFIQKEWQILQERKLKGLKIDGKKEIDVLLNYLHVFEEFVDEVGKKPTLRK